VNKEYKVHRKAPEEAKNEGLLRGPKQGTGNSEDDDYEDPAEVVCDCQMWDGAGAHVYGEGCSYKRGTRGTCTCILKWALHNESCNTRYRQLPT